MGMIEELEKAIAGNFRTLGAFIGKKPIRVIVTMLILSSLTSLGIFKLNEVNNVRTEYSPSNAPSKIEHTVAMNFLGQNGTLDPVYVLVEARDNGSLLRDEYRKTLIQLIKQIQSNITIQYKGQQYGFKELCEPYCELNAAFMAFLKLYDPNNQVTYTYPTIDFLGSQIFIGNNVYGVELEENTSFIKSFSTAVFELFISASNDEILYEWQLEIQQYYNQEEFQLFSVGLTSDCLVSVEVRRMGLETAPVLFGSVCIMIFFIAVSSIRRNPLKSKPWESLIGSLIPILSVLMSTGILSLCGLRYQSIVIVTYFLVLSVGVDDVFIIMRAWDRTSITIPIPARLAKTLENAGPSITISSLTNALSFGIGIFSSTPAVRTFSIYSCFAIIVCYFFQLILFTAVLALSGKRERNNYQALFCCFKADPSARNRTAEKISHFQNWLIKSWSSIITTWFIRALLVVVLVAYYYISLRGILKMEVKISVDKMALPDSYLHSFQFIFEKALRSMQPITVFVMNPGDLRDPDRLNGIKSMVSEYEHGLHSYGNKSTLFWLQQYDEFLSFYNESEDFTYTEIPAFFKSATYFFLSSFVHMNETACYDNQPECISSFFFVTNFHGVIRYDEMIPAVVDWRRIAAKYSDYEVYPYSDHTPFVDQTIAIKGTILWSMIAALFCSATVCFIFIPNLISISCAVFSIFSISIGIFGLLSHMEVDLDPITMAALLMAIGFSVDFTTHISYHYYKTTAKDSRDRLEEALTVIGWPMLQVAISTIVALLPLLLKQSYLAMVFIKTVTITAALGSCAEKESCRRLRKVINKIKSEVKKTQYKGRATQVGGDKEEKNAKRAPISQLDIINTAPEAYIHKIELGRALSSPISTSDKSNS
uniref:SSD domain-containing protein n=1 Tax=Loa loa TaxID=7209 RepID=A0A1I7VN58_LOALO